MEYVSEWFTFLWATVNNWAGYSTGGLVVALATLWSTLRQVPLSRKIGIGLALLFLVVAVFNAWRDQYIKSHPKIDMKIIRGGVAINSIDASGGTFIYLEMVISNSGPRTGLTPWGVWVRDNDKWIPANMAVINGGPLTMTGKGGTQVFPSRDKFIPEMTMHAVGEGDFVSGYITARFIQPMAFFEAQAERTVEVRCRDIWGNEWKAQSRLYAGAPLDMGTTTPGVR